MGKDTEGQAAKRTGRGKPSFDKGIEQLEAILDEIESGEAPLEQCLKRYEQGVKLVEHCRAILDQAQQRITELAPASPPEGAADGAADEPDETPADEPDND